MKDQQIVDKWKWDLARLRREVVLLYWDRKLYRRVMTVITANPRINKWNPLYDWMVEGYVAKAALTVRRLLDRDTRTISLARLTEQIVSNPNAMDREMSVARYDEAAQRLGIADRDFNRSATDERLEQKLQEAVTACEKLIPYVDKCIAHSDRKKPSEYPAFDDLDKGIDAVGKLFRALYLRVDGGALVSLEPAEQFDWEWVFREPWIAREEQGV